MAMLITENCISCGSCEPECPNQAISQGDMTYVIDPEKCTECVGAFDTPKCVEVCPTEGSIIPNPDIQESREQLQAKYEKLHAN